MKQALCVCLTTLTLINIFWGVCLQVFRQTEHHRGRLPGRTSGKLFANYPELLFTKCCLTLNGRLRKNKKGFCCLEP